MFEAVSPDKDVDGATSASFSFMTLGGNGFQSCTPADIGILPLPARLCGQTSERCVGDDDR
ncbi:hypothetical protein [Mycolicibacterium bacteremicum]|uniref:hypothetical protein n=1 Tax=Mycolicibacterium bacteremicum TaxID=564198 RepID=UPI00350E4E63